MKKKLISALLLLCMALSLLPFGALAADFTDLEPGAYYLEAVDWALKHNPVITKGTTDSTFSPIRPVRAIRSSRSCGVPSGRKKCLSPIPLLTS